MFPKKHTNWSSGRGLSSGLWQSYRYVFLFVIALLLTALMGRTATYPGLHLILILVVLDLSLLGPALAHNGPLLVLLVIMNLFGVIAIALGQPPLELWLTGFYGMFFVITMIGRRLTEHEYK